jgi:glycerol-3-phosphate acyltransferase PlsY
VSSLLLLASYLLGSIPSGLLLARRAGIDVRRTGSGNIGAANVARAAGARLGVATLLADVFKGALPVVVGRCTSQGPSILAAAGLLAFLGHVFPFALGFRGGKGVATALGALLALCPWAVGVPVVVFAVTLAGVGYVSVASMVAALAAPAASTLLDCPPPVTRAVLVMSLVIVARHSDNLRRLLAGTEPRISLFKKQAPPAK